MSPASVKVPETVWARLAGHGPDAENKLVAARAHYDTSPSRPF